ncbi:MAG: hypothetical protein Q4D99_01390, partial [Bacillota bacterium]|nr:hypothetical protein [Bacillota bacterium]
MRKILEESIDFSRAVNFNKEDLKVETKKASLNSRTHVLSLELVLNFIVSAESLEVFKSRLIRQLKDVRDIDLSIDYQDVKGREVPLPEKKAEIEAPTFAAGGGGKGKGGWQGGRSRRKYIPVSGNL